MPPLNPPFPSLALTLHQPWASAIVRGFKAAETRGNPPGGVPGFPGVRKLPGHALPIGTRFVIHAGREYHRFAGTAGGAGMDDRPELFNLCHHLGLVTADYPENLPRGAAVGVATLAGVVPMGAADVGEEDRCYPLDVQRHVERVAGLPLEGDIVDMVRWDARHEQEWLLGGYEPGRWALLLERPVEFTEPIPMRGNRGVWEMEPADAWAVAHALAPA